MESYSICHLMTGLFQLDNVLLKVHLCCSMHQKSLLFLWLKIFLCICMHIYIYTPHFLYPFINLGCFCHLATVNNAVMNLGVQISVWVPAFNSFGHTPSSRLVGSHGDSILNFLRNCHSVSHSGCTTLRSH